ncbi:MAG: DUF1559 domain-containing protein [Phycisphaerales bacterium]|nr:DUF1559 domain-containing protein [Planctomycetota bacterium]
MNRRIDAENANPIARPRAFTLIELLVVIAVIALLIGILLPSLASAREAGRAVICSSNMKSVGVAVMQYTSDYKYFPPSYIYPPSDPNAPKAQWRFSDQTGDNPPQGYIHWSYFLFNSGQVPLNAFTCPSVPGKGAPRTNPGDNPNDAEIGQIPGSPTTALADMQAPRISIAGNGAIFPRNKFVNKPRRENVLVTPGSIDSEPGGMSRFILAGELGYSKQQGWAICAKGQDEGSSDVGFISASHRPFTPFLPLSGSSDPNAVYDEPDGTTTRPRFLYPDPKKDINPKQSVPRYAFTTGGSTSLDGAARHHAGDDANVGAGNYVFVDGHVERLSVTTTITKRLWGNKFYSISGKNRVYDPDGADRK